MRLPRCVASSSVPEQIRRKLELTGLLTYFGDNLFSATMVARGKPAPDLFLHAAEQLGAARLTVSSSRTARQVSRPPLWPG